MQPPPQNPYAQQPAPYVQQPQPMGYPQQGGYPQQMPMQQATKRRNPALIVVGCILFAIGALAFLVFAWNAYQYATVEDRFGDIKGSEWVVDLIKESDLKRMAVFGPVAAIFAIVGAVLGFLGIRKR